jgi:hypothetical protein
MYDENYIIVNRWDSVIGGWVDVDEARDADNAREIARQVGEKNPDWILSIVYFQRTIIR